MWRIPFTMALALLAVPLTAQMLAPDFAGSHSIRSLGNRGAIKNFLGCSLFKRSDSSTLLIGVSPEKICELKIQRDLQGHLSGFSAEATFVANAPEEPSKKDGTGLSTGWDMGPDGVLFFPTFSGYIGQIKPGSVDPNRYVSGKEFGLTGRVLGMAFVPSGFPGAGHLKLTSYTTWSDTRVQPDGSGTFSILPVSKTVAQGGYGFVYVPAGRAGFSRTSVLMLVNQSQVNAYEVDANGDPIGATERPFITGFSRVLSALMDPLTGDFVFSSVDSSKPPIFVVGSMAAALPEVRLTAPIEGARYRAPATFYLTATAQETGGMITRVELFQGKTLLFNVSQPGPYGRQVGNLPAGEYEFSAVAYDGAGNSATSKVVRVSVVNEGPVVSLTTPTSNTVLPACADMPMVARVNPGNSPVAQVRFLDDDTLLRSFDSASKDEPISVLARDAREGTHNYWVEVIDANGLVSTAVATNVVVQPLPLHELRIHHFQTNELEFCFKSPPGSNFVWETSSTVKSPMWRPFLTNQAPAGTWRLTNAFDPATAAGFFRTRQWNLP